MKLEKEFELAKSNHILRICKRALENQIKAEINSTVNIPTFLLKEQIQEEVVNRIAEAFRNNALTDLYEVAWEEVKETL